MTFVGNEALVAYCQSTVRVPFEAEVPIASARLHYTSDEGLRTERKRETAEGKVLDGEMVVEGLPSEANTWVVEVTDERGMMVTSEVGFGS